MTKARNSDFSSESFHFFLSNLILNILLQVLPLLVPLEKKKMMFCSISVELETSLPLHHKIQSHSSHQKTKPNQVYVSTDLAIPFSQRIRHIYPYIVCLSHGCFHFNIWPYLLILHPPPHAAVSTGVGTLTLLWFFLLLSLSHGRWFGFSVTWR